MNLKETLNHHGSMAEPFFFCISYDLKDWTVTRLNTLDASIEFKIDNSLLNTNLKQPEVSYLPFEKYTKQFQKVINEIKLGNTYLLNLTSSSMIESDYTLKEIFDNTNAKYKLLYKDSFVSFSPETFVKINNNTISTYPMKGTIDSSLPHAKELLLNNQKEFAEHVMIVDLLRNDLNLVSKNVHVEKFRYIDKIQAGNKMLYQVSSKVCGDLDKNWKNKIGDILLAMLPAGSITGTPKKSTIDIIKNVESHDRGWFTGIWGIFDGNSLDSSVLIRYLEKKENQYIYKSGGGLTLDSNLEDEYQEMKDKVYFP